MIEKLKGSVRKSVSSIFLKLTQKEASFAEVSTNLTRYRSENNFVWIVKIIT